MKICAECRHCFAAAYCYSPHLGIDRVTGEERSTFCDVERSAELEGACGPAGRFWEGKDAGESG
jgi:hypothetical protein